MNFAACSIRRLIASFASRLPRFEVTNPSTTILPSGTKRSGSKPPALRHFRRRLGTRSDEFEMLDHGMGADTVELSVHPQHHRLGLRTLELDLAIAAIGFDAVELAEKIIVPKRAAEFAVGNRA